LTATSHAELAGRVSFHPNGILLEWLLNQPVLNWKMVSKCGSSPKKIKRAKMFRMKPLGFQLGPKQFFSPCVVSWCNMVCLQLPKKKESRVWLVARAPAVAAGVARELRGQTQASHSSRPFASRRRSGMDASDERPDRPFSGTRPGGVERTGRCLVRARA